MDLEQRKHKMKVGSVPGKGMEDKVEISLLV